MTTTSAITEYSPTEAALAGLRQKYGSIVWVVDTSARMAVAKMARAEIREWRTSLETERKHIKAPALERCKAIDAEAKRITIELEALEGPVDAAIKAEEFRKKEEHERRECAESERIAKAQADIEEIRGVAHGAVGLKAVDIDARITELSCRNVTRTDEFSDAARIARGETVARLRELYTAACAQEAEQAKVAAERAELARLRAEQDMRRAEEERQQRAVEAEAKAKLEAEQKAARERIAEEERQARIAREAADSEARALRAKADEEARQARLAEQARLDVERQKLEAQREAAESVEREKRRRAADMLDARAMLRAFVGRYGKLAEFSGVVKAIGECLGKSEKAEAA